MSDLMLHAILNIPPDLWRGDPLDVKQRHGRYVDASQRIKDDEATIAALTAKLEAAERRSEYWKAEHLAGNAVITKQAAQIEALEKDAERYRWLRSNSVGPSQIWELLSDDCSPPVMTLKAMHDLDAAIDAAILGDSHV